jgi:Glycosyl-4,4'-diaponeurosporenoate acyltransferase
MTSTSVQLWGARIVFIGSLVVLPCVLAGSPFPAFAFALAWGPNGLFLWWFMRGVLHLPLFLVPVKPVEPVLYRWLGVGFVKRIVATPMWSLMNGQEPPPKPRNPQELLVRIDLSTRGAEVCHGATFLLVFLVALFFLAVGQFSEAVWLAAFNILLNGYPVMLQRANRWRVQHIRASPEHLARAEA